MPLLWRYLLWHYLKVLVLCIVSFISLLLVSRLQEIAQFALLGTKGPALACFILFQIPYILPLALPIAALLSAMLLFQRLSHTHELTAMRAGGISLPRILAPILFTSALLSLGNFLVTSELATEAHLATRRMAYNIASINPLTLLQNAKIGHLKGAYVHLDPIARGQSARNVTIAVQLKPQGPLQLLMCDEVSVGEGVIRGKGVTLVSPLEENGLAVETQEFVETDAASLAHMLRSKGWKMAWDHLKFKYLLLRLAATRSPKGYSEIARRVALGLAPFTFTLLGAAFGVQIGRRHSKRGLVIVLGFASFTLICFFAGKELDHLFFTALILFLAPHLLITSAALFSLRRHLRGIE